MGRLKVTADVAVVLALCLGAACGGRKVTADSGGTGGSGGAGGRSSANTGGTGASAPTGGASAGGNVGTGGVAATGGASAGGTVGTGGAAATGGASAGGAVGTGGVAATGGASAGGTVGTGGAVATGGASAGGGGGLAGIGGTSAGGGGSAGVGGAAGGAAGDNGCPQDGTILNAGCATRALGEMIASPADHAILSCQVVGPCHRWRISVNCMDQALTAGVVNGQPACVCLPGGSWFGSPPTTKTLYVDPDPPQASFMQGPITGSIHPPACRYRTLTQALAVARDAPGGTFGRVTLLHESSGNPRLQAETFPIEIPPGVEVVTADYPSMAGARYTIDLGGGPTPRVVLGNGASLLGLTLNGTATNNPLGGTVPGTVLVTSSNASSGGTATLRLVNLLGTSGSGQTGIFVRGSAAMTAELVTIRDMNLGIDVRLTDPTAGAMASFTGNSIYIVSTSPLATGARVGPAGSILTLTGTSIQVPGTAVVVEGGQATLNGVPVP